MYTYTRESITNHQYGHEFFSFEKESVPLIDRSNSAWFGMKIFILSIKKIPATLIGYEFRYVYYNLLLLSGMLKFKVECG